MKDITDTDYAHVKRFCKDFEIKHLGEYQDLYLQKDTLLLAVYLRNLEIFVVKYMSLITLNFFQVLD